MVKHDIYALSFALCNEIMHHY